MTHLITPVNLLIAIVTLGVGTVKAVAARHKRDWTLRLTASVLITAGMIFLLAAPTVYRAVGTLTHSPNLSALLVPSATLICVAHAHALSQLWREDRRDPASLRRTAARWGPFYGSAIVAMTVLYFHAPLGEAAPLRFAAEYAPVPEVVAFHIVYWIALITTVVVTVRECWQLSIPGRPDFVEDLRRCIGYFAVALGFDLVNVLLTAIALVGSATGAHSGRSFAESAWLATIASCVAANMALASLVLRSRRAERRDKRALQALHDLVVREDPTVASNPHVLFAPRWSLWTGFDTSFELAIVMTQIHDGCGRLSPWWSPLPSVAVARLYAAEPPQGTPSKGRPDDVWDLTAAQAAATLLHAAQARGEAQAPYPPQVRLSRLPGSDIEIHEDRQHLVLVAQHLSHPRVLRAVDLAGQAQSVGRAS
ncbi:hypothetical protein [[Kitasatospora] papulosa]|uniref:hypothetical protein n=1 Tax=[Kitasatospora] papulosa TaxID=1464011 RepID=UPI00363DB13E